MYGKNTSVCCGCYSNAVMYFQSYLRFISFILISSNTSASDLIVVNGTTTVFEPLSTTTNSAVPAATTSSGDIIFKSKTVLRSKSSRKCQCVSFGFCNAQHVYIPKGNEGSINCGPQEICCNIPTNTQNSTLSPEPAVTLISPALVERNRSTEMVCVAYNQCDKSVLTSYRTIITFVGETVLACPPDKVLCPADKTLLNSDSDVSLRSGLSDVDNACICTPVQLCRVGYEENLIMIKMSVCGVTETCCLINSILPSNVDDLTIRSPSPNYECGLRNDTTELFSSESLNNTRSGDYPWTVLILERVNNVEKIICGASLISFQFVLTAAHCVANKSIEMLIIRAGEYDLRVPANLKKNPRQDRMAANLIIHPDYARKYLLHDLALISVDKPFTYASNVAPICLPSMINSGNSSNDLDIYDLDRCVGTGSGAKSVRNKTHLNVSSQVELRVIPRNICTARLRASPLGPKFFLDTSFICVTKRNGSDICKADGGGPLICPLKSNTNKYVQIGVLAGGLNCSSPFPSLFASLLHDSEWLTKEINI